jgi:hypothetical protein
MAPLALAPDLCPPAALPPDPLHPRLQALGSTACGTTAIPPRRLGLLARRVAGKVGGRIGVEAEEQQPAKQEQQKLQELLPRHPAVMISVLYIL